MVISFILLISMNNSEAKENLDAGHSWGLKGYPVVGLIFENL